MQDVMQKDIYAETWAWGRAQIACLGFTLIGLVVINYLYKHLAISLYEPIIALMLVAAGVRQLLMQRILQHQSADPFGPWSAIGFGVAIGVITLLQQLHAL